MKEVFLREIEPGDNTGIAAIIRQVLTALGVPDTGTALADESLDQMYQYYHRPGAVYYVAGLPGRMLGGAGIAPLKGGPEEICELQKMYLADEARGYGLGSALIERCLKAAGEMGYSRVYLETMPYMKTAQALYLKQGFRYLEGPLGDTGHCSCQVWMIRELPSTINHL